MYALHPGSLPPKDVRGTTRIDVTADDLVRLYKLKSWEYIVWDPTDHYEWFDFIHLYPSYYGRYELLHGSPAKDIPCDAPKSSTQRGSGKTGGSSNSSAATSTRGKPSRKS